MDIPVQWLPLLFLAGGFAGFVNVVAGGGSFFSFPMLILLGFAPQVATGTIRVTIVMQNLVAVPTYARGGYFFPRETLLCSLVTIPAALAGSFTAVRLDPTPFRHVTAILVLLVLGTLFIQPRNWTRTERLPRIRWGRMLLALAGVGFYGGFFQLGAGMPFLAAAVLAGGWDLVSANSLKVSVILLFTIIALAVFALHGDVDWRAGFVLGLGNMVGAWLGARSAVKRGPGWIRWVLVGMGVLAAARLLFPSGADAAPARAANDAGEFPVSVAMHLHGPFSEGNASIEWHTDHAKKLGVDALWWTEHDWRLENFGKTRRFDFENATLGAGTNRIDEPDDDAMAGETRSWAPVGAVAAAYQVAISSKEARAGSRSLELKAVVAAGGAWEAVTLAQQSSRRRHRVPLASHPHLRFSLLPVALDAADARFFVEAQLSEHPEGRHVLRWAAGSLDGEDADTFPLAWTPGVWNDFDLDVAAAAAALFSTAQGESVPAIDNSLYEVRIGLAHRGASLPRVHFDEYVVGLDDIDGRAMVDRQGSMVAWYEAAAAGPDQHVGTEISRFPAQPHLNAYTPDRYFPDYGAHTDGEPLDWAVDQVHAAGGVVSLNHLFGTWVYPFGETEPERLQRLASMTAGAIASRAFGADLFEVGYRVRGGMTLEEHLGAWDALTANRVFLTGNGVSDSHGTDLFVGWAPWSPAFDLENNFVTWLWAREASRDGLLGALRRGRAYFGDPYRFDGTLDLATANGIPMGGVVVTDRDETVVRVTATGLPTGAFVELTRFGIDEAGGVPAAAARQRTKRFLGMRRGDGTFEAEETIPTATAGAVRVSISDGGETFVLSNPICFLRAWPVDGIPGERAAADVGGAAVRAAAGFALREASWNDADDRLTLSGDETVAGAGSVRIDVGGRGGPATVEGAASWRYADGVLMLDGFSGAGSVIVARWDGGPGDAVRLAVRPNPFRGVAGVDFTLSPAGDVSVDVWSVSGRRVRRLAAGRFDAGTHRVEWDGRSDAGTEAASGVYWIRLRAAGVERTAKVVKLR